MPQFFLAIPAFNESARLPKFLAELCGTIAESGIDTKIAVVDDGSRPAERDIVCDHVKQLQRDFPDLLADPIVLSKNQGKGGAVYAGWDSTAAEGADWLAFVDADGAIAPREVVRIFRSCLEEDSGEASRHAYFGIRPRGAADVQRTLLRNLSGLTFRTLVRVLFRFPVSDTQCGFKIVPTPPYRRIAPLLSERRFCFDLELTYRLLQAGVEVKEAPIAWKESPGSKMGPTTAVSMFLSVIQLKLKFARERGSGLAQ